MANVWTFLAAALVLAGVILVVIGPYPVVTAIYLNTLAIFICMFFGAKSPW